jgi:ABC-type uncharacterized transport system auxiliary subunit
LPTLVAVLAIAALLSGCGQPQTRYYFTLGYPLEENHEAEPRAALHPVSLRIRPFKAALPFDRSNLAFRESPYEYQYYALRFWAAKPQHMLRELVEAHLQSARVVTEVSREIGDRTPDYELAGEVEAIEEYDSGDLWYAHLAMRFELVRYKDQTTVWRSSFDRMRKVYKREPSFVMRTLSAILKEEMIRLTAEIDGVLSKERGVAPTLAVPPRNVEEETPTGIE